MNLITKNQCNPGNYYCTWLAQNYSREDSVKENNATLFEGDQGARLARDFMEETNIFSQNGLINQFDRARSDLYFVFDDGWDVPFHVHPNNQRYRFGSLKLNEDRFPSCIGTPAHRLKKLNDFVKQAGWRGAGIWVSAQSEGEGNGSSLLAKNEMENYWRERAEWCAEAGIEYWKVDWGFHEYDKEFRAMLTRIAKETYPDLIVENCRNCGPFNDDTLAPLGNNTTIGDGRFKSWGSMLEDAQKILSFSDVLRSYDVSPYLSTATTLDRLGSIFDHATVNEGADGIVNCEDEPYIGAALGCNFGIMRSKYLIKIPGMNYDPNNTALRSDEVTRATMWQRIAPPFGANKTKIYLSNNILTDTWHFSPGDFWASWVIGKDISQASPAVVSRGIENIKVSGKMELPYVAASINPNGAFSIASLPRTSIEKCVHSCSADISVNGINAKSPIGIFGKYKSLTLQFNCDISCFKVWAQDLAGYSADNITGLVTINKNTMIIPEDTIEKIGLANATPGDLSDPGLVLELL